MKPTYEELEAQVKNLEAEHVNDTGVISAQAKTIRELEAQFRTRITAQAKTIMGQEAQVKQLAAEKAALKLAVSAVNHTAEECEFNGDELRYAVGNSEFEALTDLLGETPATDAFLSRLRNESRAEGVDMLNSLFKKCTGTLDAESVVSTAEHFACQLREGKAGEVRSE